MTTLLLAGASGLIGRELLAQSLAAGDVVHALVRRDVPGWPASPHLHTHRFDFAQAGALPRADALYIALGTTIKVAGSQAAFRAVDFDAVVQVARAAHRAGVSRCAVVSALGAATQSGVFYNRIKGEMELALAQIGFERLVIARPSLLAGARAALGQPARRGEQWMLRLLSPVHALIPERVRPIDAAVVARAMRLALAQGGPAVDIIESAALQQLGAATRP